MSGGRRFVVVFGEFRLDESGCAVKQFSSQVLELFQEMGKDQLDLHVLFESGGNDPVGRERVLDAIDELLEEGMVENAGGDFYSLTEKGKRALARS